MRTDLYNSFVSGAEYFFDLTLSLDYRSHAFGNMALLHSYSLKDAMFLSSFQFLCGIASNSLAVEPVMKCL